MSTTSLSPSTCPNLRLGKSSFLPPKRTSPVNHTAGKCAHVSFHPCHTTWTRAWELCWGCSAQEMNVLHDIPPPSTNLPTGRLSPRLHARGVKLERVSSAPGSARHFLLPSRRVWGLQNATNLCRLVQHELSPLYRAKDCRVWRCANNDLKFSTETFGVHSVTRRGGGLQMQC